MTPSQTLNHALSSQCETEVAWSAAWRDALVSLEVQLVGEREATKLLLDDFAERGVEYLASLDKYPRELRGFALLTRSKTDQSTAPGGVRFGLTLALRHKA